MSRTGGESATPRAVIHKRILDIAASNPSASMAEIADKIAGASTDLVERVLDQYGDPAGEKQSSQGHTEEQDSPDDTETQADHSMNPATDHENVEGSESTQTTAEPDIHTEENGRTATDYSNLTDKQVRTLRVIEEQPNVSQADIAEKFGVSRATISRWVNDIPGFEWRCRQKHASKILTSVEIRDSAEQDNVGQTETQELDALRQQLEALERQLDEMKAEPETNTRRIDADLAYKVVHAALQSDRITEAEELQLLKRLMA